jgi:hypothetical protein
MARSRLTTIIGLVTLFGALAGCGGSKPTTGGAAPAPAPGPQPSDTRPDPKPGQDAYELDPTKHVIPAVAATGRLAGKTFTPDRVELEENKLTFRQGKDFFPDLDIDIFLDNTKKLSEGVKLVVRPNQKWTENIPSLHVSTRKGKDDLPDTKFVNEGYALTLELGKAEKGKSSGKIYLCLPGSERSYLAGTFVVERKRSLSEPPGAEEVPFIQGSVTPALKKGQSVQVGYVGLPADGKVISDIAGGQVFGNDGDGGSRSLTHTPRAASVQIEKFIPRFDFTNLPPGRYLVYARIKDGPSAWAWATVPADGRVTADLKLDEKTHGTVEVKLPVGEREARLVPTDLGTPPPDDRFLDQLLFALEFRAEAKDGKATIGNVPAGKYQVRAGSLRADVEVTAGKTAAVELKPAKN